MPTLTIAGIVTTPSSTNGATFCRHDRRSPRARRIDALYSASVGRTAAAARTLVRPVARGRRPHPPAAGDSAGAHDGSPLRRRNTSSSDVEPCGQPEQRQSEVGDEVADEVEVVVAVDGRPRRRSSTTTCRETDAGERRPRARRVATPDVDGDHPGALEQRLGRARHDQPAGVDHHARGRTPAARRRAGGWPSAPRCRTSRGGRRGRASPRGRSGRGRRSARRAAPVRDRRRAPGRAWCAGACRSRSRRSAGSGPRRGRRGRGCREARWRAARAGSPLSSPKVATTSAAVWSSGRQSCSGM